MSNNDLKTTATLSVVRPRSSIGSDNAAVITLANEGLFHNLMQRASVVTIYHQS